MLSSATYADVEIRIHKKQEQGYPVELTVNSEQEFYGGHLDPSFLPWVPSVSSSVDGERLFNWLFADDTFKTAWAEIRGQHSQRRLRLRIDVTAPELHAIPWELLRDTSGETVQDLAATTATPFSRYLAGKWQPGSPILKRPIRILLAVATPDNLTEYNLVAIDSEVELGVLEASLEEIDEVELTLLAGPCTLQAIEGALRQGYHILHLVAHGTYSKQRQQTVLYLADEDDQVALVNGQDLAAGLARQLADVDTLYEDKLRLVFLASCQTATHNPADAFRALAPALVAAGIPAVLAMQDLVPLRTAQAFSRTFYQQLLTHGQVDLAGNEARSTLMAAKFPGAAIPVLYQRLRSGGLLGMQGHITSQRDEEEFWSFLLDYIANGQCTPFLGPRVNAGLLPDAGTIARALATRHHYPLAETDNLAQVAQFIGLKAPGVLRSNYLQFIQRQLFNYLGLKPSKEEKLRFSKLSFSKTVTELDWAERILLLQEDQIHHLLADLKLPLYVTTNFDNFMVEALKCKGLTPRQVGLRWNPGQEAEKEKFIISPVASSEEPIVLHLNGFDGEPEQRRNLVLSEDDYLAHFMRISRDQQTVLPMNLLQMLSQNSFLFLGYNLDDWEFRILLQGLLKEIAKTGGKELHVRVQLGINNPLNEEEAVDYLRRYLGQFNIDIYWGTTQQFVTELHTRWQAYQSQYSWDSWADDDG